MYSYEKSRRMLKRQSRWTQRDTRADRRDAVLRERAQAAALAVTRPTKAERAVILKLRRRVQLLTRITAELDRHVSAYQRADEARHRRERLARSPYRP